MSLRIAVTIVSLASFLSCQLEAQAATPYRKLTQIWATYQFDHYLVNKETLIKGLKSAKLSEPETQLILKKIENVNEWPKFEKLGDHFMISSSEAVLTVKSTDLKTNSYEINGLPFKYDPSLPFETQLKNLEKILSKKKATLFSIIPEAQATPLHVLAAILLVAAVVIGGITAAVCAVSVVKSKLSLLSTKVEPNVGLDECLGAILDWPMNKERVTDVSCEDRGYYGENHTCRVVKISHAAVNNPDSIKSFTVTIEGNGEVGSINSSDGTPVPDDLKPYLQAYAKIGQKADTRGPFNESLKSSTPRVNTLPPSRGTE